jgi:LysR family transcriptional regulator, glycine cleavage system transcriptional activator
MGLIMVSPYRSLPPLPTLRTFEAVARQLSFTRAADELALTQSAVSHQIGALERHLGARLFSRLNPGIELTEEGRVFLEGARAGLDSILLATDRIRSRYRVGMLTISAPSAFATWWLVPRLGRFAALHPEIEVRIAVIEGREPDLQRDGVDAAIVQRPAGAAADSGMEMPLLRETIFPVCAPTLLREGSRHGIDLAAQTLIECEPEGEETAELGWDYWLARLGSADDIRPRRLRFTHLAAALSAAVDGVGIALGRAPMVDAELAAGRLVRPFGKRALVKAHKVYSLLWRTAPDQRVVAFRDFALDEACGCELAAGPCGMPASERDSRTRPGWLASRAARRAAAASVA